MSFPNDLDTRSSLLKYFRQQNSSNYAKQVADILLDLLVLMTFGMASPLLGLLVVLKQITTGVVTRMSIGRYIQQAEDPSAALAALEDAAQQFRGGDTRAVLGFLLVVVGIFWGAMIFDMVADLYGNTTGGIAWAVAFTAWAAAAAVAYRTKLGDKVAASILVIFRRVTGIGDDKSAHLVAEKVDTSITVLAETRNSLFRSEVAGSVDDGYRIDIHKHNSAFAEERKSESEMTAIVRNKDGLPVAAV